MAGEGTSDAWNDAADVDVMLREFARDWYRYTDDMSLTSTYLGA